jgi:hypothetical protein
MQGAPRKRWRVWFLGVLVLYSACSSGGQSVKSGAPTDQPSPVQSDSAAASQACRGVQQGVGPGAVLRAAFETDGSVIPKWQETRAERQAQAQAQAEGKSAPPVPAPSGPGLVSPFARAHASDRTVYLCYFDGTFTIPAPPGANMPNPNRISVFVATNGESAPDQYGYHDTPGYGDMTFERPSA